MVFLMLTSRLFSVHHFARLTPKMSSLHDDGGVVCKCPNRVIVMS